MREHECEAEEKDKKDGKVARLARRRWRVWRCISVWFSELRLKNEIGIILFTCLVAPFNQGNIFSVKKSL
jgi:hypothetical protein